MRIVAALKMAAVAAALAGASVLAAAAAVAQAPASPPTIASADPAYAAAQSAFEALPEADRRAVQDALVWTGDYKGIVDGHFGKGTRDSIAAFAQHMHLPANGTLDDKARAGLIATAAKAKQAAAFTPTSDGRSGVRIGVPVKLLPKKSDLKAGTRYAAADGTAALETTTATASDTDLPAMFDRLTAAIPGRRVIYKVLRPDFLVVSGTIASATFYTRVARGGVDGAALLRGYTLTYPSALKPQFDVISIAVANTFDPFPAPVAIPPAAATGGAATPFHGTMLVASALVVGPGLAVSILPAAACAAPLVDGRPARISRQDAGTALALLAVPGLTGQSLPPFAAAPDAGTAIVVLFQTAIAGATRPENELFATTGEIIASTAVTASPAITAPLQGPATGALVFDRAGRLVGLVAAVPQMPRLVAGIVPPSTYPIVPAPALAAFLGDAGPAPQAAKAAQAAGTAAAIVAAAGKSIAAVTCTL